MNDIIREMLNMTVSASILVFIVLIYRTVFRKAPKWISCLLWGIVGLKLIIPFSFSSAVGLLPSENIISSAGNINTGIVTIDNSAREIKESVIAPVVESAASHYGVPSQSLVSEVLFIVWLFGITVMLVLALISYIKLNSKVKASVKSGRVYLCDNIETPFIFGIFKPEIYVPSFTGEYNLKPVIAHETAHIKRKDHWWKPLGYLILSAYWFNPVIWLAYILLCKDIELACDEKVIRDMEANDIADYSQALLDWSKPVKAVRICPVAFGETGVKQRIKSVLSYKIPALWIIIAAVIASAVVAVCFTTNHKNKNDFLWNGTERIFVTYDIIDSERCACYRLNEDGTIEKIGEKFSGDISKSMITGWVEEIAHDKDISSLPVSEIYGKNIDAKELSDIYRKVNKEISGLRYSAADAFAAGTQNIMVFVREQKGKNIITHLYCYDNGLKEIDSFENEILYGAYDSADKYAPVGTDDGIYVLNAVNCTYQKNEEAYSDLGCECSTSGYVIFGTEETEKERKIYSYISFSRFGFENGFFIEKSGGSNPAVIIIDKKTDEWKLEAPRDGELFGTDIQKLFPKKYQRRAMEPTENDMKSIWEQEKEQARKYLDSIGRSAEICSYSEIEHILFSDLGISAEVDNAISTLGLPYNPEIGNYERIEDGVRYVYRTDYDKKSKLIKFTKFEFGTDNIAQYIEINAKTGDIVSTVSNPIKEAENSDNINYYKPDYNAVSTAHADRFLKLFKKNGYYQDGEIKKDYNTDNIKTLVNITPKSISDEINNVELFLIKETGHCFLMADNKIFRYETFGGYHLMLCLWDYDKNGTKDLVSYDTFGSGISYLGVNIFDLTQNKNINVITRNTLNEPEFSFEFKNNRIYLDGNELTYNNGKFQCNNVITDKKNEAKIKNKINGNIKDYCEMDDGSWSCNGITYKYRLEITGRLPNSAADTTFVYLSNIKEISFDRAYKACGISSYMNDYFAAEDAVLVSMT